MINPASLTLLLEQRQLLYKNLLDCSTQQVDLLNRRDEESFPDLFHKTSEEWSSLTNQIEEIQCKLNTVFAKEDHDQISLVEIVQSISNNTDIIESSLRESEMEVHADMNSVNNQKKIMNAYFGAQFGDASSLYFDEKK